MNQRRNPTSSATRGTSRRTSGFDRIEEVGADVRYFFGERWSRARGGVGVCAPNRPVAGLRLPRAVPLQHHRGRACTGITQDQRRPERHGGQGHGARHPGLRRADLVAPRRLSRDQSRTRYSTTGSSSWRDAGSRSIARIKPDAFYTLGHNGNLAEHRRARGHSLQAPGLTADETSFDSTTDSTLVAELIAREWPDEPRSDGRELEHALEKVLPRLKGGFSFVLMDDARLIGVRDPHGFWPLALGRLEGGGWVLASETTALDIVGAHCRPRRAARARWSSSTLPACGTSTVSPSPTEAVFYSVRLLRPTRHQPVWPASTGRRQRMGEELAAQAPVDADMVMPIPEWGSPRGRGVLREHPGDPLRRRPGEEPLHRSHLHPAQPADPPGQSVRMKLKSAPRGTSAARSWSSSTTGSYGTATHQVVAMLREAGAVEIHFRVSSPPYRWPCYYGMDTGRKSDCSPPTSPSGRSPSTSGSIPARTSRSSD